mgnify:CR=1 FL=1
MPIKIPLTQGKVALIDAADLPLVSRYKWCADRHRHTFYAMTKIRRSDRTWTTLYMHRLLLNAPLSMKTDHVNGNGLDNRRANLRPATHAENLRNRGPQRNNTTGFKGVSFDKTRGKFQARIMLSGREIHLGRFITPQKAHAAYCAAAAKLHGKFARGE